MRSKTIVLWPSGSKIQVEKIKRSHGLLGALLHLTRGTESVSSYAKTKPLREHGQACIQIADEIDAAKEAK